MFRKKNIAKIIGKTFLPHTFHLLSNKPKILFYHGVENDSNIKDSIVQANQMPVSIFERQIKYLKKKYNVISLDEFYYKLLDNKKFKGNELVITFDDGYRNNLTVAAPILKANNFPFTVFICPDLIENSLRVPTFYVRSSILYSEKKFLDLEGINIKLKIETKSDKLESIDTLIKIIKTAPKNKVDLILKDLNQNLSVNEIELIKNKFISEDLMNWEEVNEIIDYDCIIGSHCLDHTILHSNQNDEEVDKQLILSKKSIENKITKSSNYFAFPNGDKSSVSDYSLSRVNNYYDLGFAVDGSSVTNNKMNYVSRIGIANDYDLFKFQVEILSQYKAWS
ncbi:polysaccharide deacetylase family protein [Tenacibaculum sp. A30]|uniref:polysaccharide deacetylase family protein n=1 Tax=Tenacibaculum sp. A30 TaxID=3442644 RepID=UPI003EBE874B